MYFEILTKRKTLFKKEDFEKHYIYHLNFGFNTTYSVYS